MTDATGTLVGGITGFLSSEAFPILIMLVVGGAIVGYILVLYLARKGI